jgi:hypothetical protein
MEGSESVATRSAPVPQSLPGRGQLGSASSAGRGGVPLQRVGSAASIVSSSHVSENGVEREIANGTRTVIAGIAFPTVVAKKIPGSLLKVSKYTASPFLDTVTLTCFVDLHLDPPRPLSLAKKCSSPAMEAFTHSQRWPERPSSSVTRPGSRDLNNRAVRFTGDVEPHISTPEDEPMMGKNSAQSSASGSPVKLPKADSNDASFSFVESLVTPNDSAVVAKEASSVRRHPRGPYCVRVPSKATVAEATIAVHAYLRKKQAQEKTEMLNTGGTLFGQRVDGDAHIAPPRKLQGLNAFTVTTHALATLDDLPQQDDPTPRLVLRPCDPLGFVLDRSAVSPSAALPISKSIMSCFPKGCTSFFVCLAPDPEETRESIRGEKLAAEQRTADALRQLQNERTAAVMAMEDNRRQREADAHCHSVARDAALRHELFQPKGSAAYKHFVKTDVIDEKHRQREAENTEKERIRSEHFKAAKAAWLQFFESISHLEEDSRRSHKDISKAEWLERQRIADERAVALELHAKRERCAVLLRRVPEDVERFRLASSPFAGWKL